MDEENKTEVNEQVQLESNQQVENETKKFDLKKYIPVIGCIVAIIIIVGILIAIFGGGPKKTVKQYVSGINKQNASKILKSMDFAGAIVWIIYDEDDFSKDDYNDFIDYYKDIDKDEIKDETDDLEEIIEDTFDEIKDEYKSYKLKIEKFKSVDKLGKNLYAVDVKVSLTAKPKDKDDKEIDESKTITFIVYKNKIISAGSLSF